MRKASRVVALVAVVGGASSIGCGGVGVAGTPDASFDGPRVDARKPIDVGPTLCTPGTAISCACIGGTTGTQVCNAIGQAYGACACGDGSVIRDGASPEAGCVDGKSACLGATPEQCVEGTWITQPACAGASPVCLQGACVECAPSAMRCSGGTPEICTAAGAWVPQAACSCTESLCAGACIDSQTDPLNCGACGHDCYGGTCVAGVCQPATIASGQLAPFAITVDATNVYWTNHIENGSVVKMALAGGTITTLANGLIYPSHITVDTRNVYWTSTDWATYGSTADAGPPVGAISEIAISPTAGATPLTLASGLYAPDSIVTNGSKVMWTDWGNFRDGPNAGSLSEAAVTGGPVTTLATGQFDPTGLAVNGQNLYWCNQNDSTAGDGVVFALPTPFVGQTRGFLATVPTSGESTPVYLAIDTKNIYWTDFDGGFVIAEPIGGGTETTLATGVAPYGIAADGTNVYWSDWGNGTVMKVALDSGVITTLASQQDNPLTIAVDATRVYWASYNRGTVLSIAK